MNKSIFLGKVIGWYLVIMSLALLLREHEMHAIMTGFMSQPTLLFFVAAFTLILGLLLVVSHNVWVKGWPVVITVIAWLTLIGGVVRLFAPEYLIQGAQWWLKSPHYLVCAAVVYLIVGVFLLYKAHRA